MAAITLTYFDIPTSRGEECRLALFLAGLEFTDERLTREAWARRKASTPFGALPVLTVEGHRPIAQSNAILRLIGSLHGLLPSDPYEAGRHEAVLGAVEDMRARLGPTGRLKDPEEKKRAREELARDYLPEWAGHLELQVNGPFIGGAAISVADLKVFVALGPLLKGAIDHIPPETFRGFSRLLQLFEAVKAHPRVVAWYAR
jgi:prostaglandin-H2 D-isomerase / glutathione transferase